MAKNLLITGATGNIASATIPHLVGKGVSLRALVRDPGKAKKLAEQGVELVQGDLSSHRALPKAFAGADTLLLIHPPGPRAPEQSSNAVWAAKQAGVKRIVRLSAVGAGYDAPTVNGRMHGLSDEELRHSGLAHTIVRPHFFLQNLLGMAGSIKQGGAFYFAMGDGKMSAIDARDIGEFFARVLTTDGHDGKTYDLTGPAAITLHDAAAAIGKATGKAVKYVPVPLAAAEQSMAGMGMDPWMVGMMLDYSEAYARSWKAEPTKDFSTVMGKPARSVDDFAKDFAAAF